MLLLDFALFPSASGGSDDRDDVGYSRRRPTRATKTTNPEAVSSDGAEEMSRKQSKSTSSAPAGKNWGLVKTWEISKIFFKKRTPDHAIDGLLISCHFFIFNAS